MGSTNEPAPDRAEVVALPPVIFGCAVLLGVAAKWLLGGTIASASGPRLPAGAALVGFGALCEVWFSLAFKAAGQDVKPTTPTPAIIDTGPFRYSRNPAYLGLVALQVGLALLLDNPWVLLTLVPALFIMHYGVILREEAYLERKFGADYLRYKARVRRWL